MGMNLRSAKVILANTTTFSYNASADDDIILIQPQSGGNIDINVNLPKNPSLNQVITVGIQGQYSGDTINTAIINTQNNTDIVFPAGGAGTGVALGIAGNSFKLRPITLVYTETNSPSTSTDLSVTGNFVTRSKFQPSPTAFDDNVRVRVGDKLTILISGSGSSSLVGNTATVRETDGSTYLICDPVADTSAGATIKLNSKRGIWVQIS